MEFEGPGDSGLEQGAAEIAAKEQDARNQAATKAGDERSKAFQDELSGTVSGRMERFGVGPQSKGGLANAAQKSKTNDSFHLAAYAQGYNQSVTFNVGGHDVSMSLGDMRDVASDRYNHYAAQLRTLKAQGADADKIRAAQQRMDAYGDLMHLTDDVAAGRASPDKINDYIQRNDLGQEIVDTAISNPDISVSDIAPQAEEAARAGAYADQTADKLNTDFIDSIYNAP